METYLVDMVAMEAPSVEEHVECKVGSPSLGNARERVSLMLFDK